MQLIANVQYHVNHRHKVTIEKANNYGKICEDCASRSFIEARIKIQLKKLEVSSSERNRASGTNDPQAGRQR